MKTEVHKARDAEEAACPKDDRDPQGSRPSSFRPPNESRMDRIARRAHEIYVARGGQHGKALEDWLKAESEIDAEMEAPRPD